MKKVLSVVLAVIMLLSMSTSVFAAGKTWRSNMYQPQKN